MGKPIRDSKGKFAGSEGEGKKKVPTAGPGKPSTAPATDTTSASVDYDSQYSRLQQKRPVMNAPLVAAVNELNRDGKRYFVADVSPFANRTARRNLSYTFMEKDELANHLGPQAQTNRPDFPFAVVAAGPWTSQARNLWNQLDQVDVDTQEDDGVSMFNRTTGETEIVAQSTPYGDNLRSVPKALGFAVVDTETGAVWNAADINAGDLEN